MQFLVSVPTKDARCFRVTVASLNEQKQLVYTKTTGVQSASLVKNDEVRPATLRLQHFVL